MDSTLDDLLSRVTSDLSVDSEDAIVWLVLLLDRSNTSADIAGFKTAEEYYRANVPIELLSLEMDDEQQIAIARRLGSALESNPNNLSWLAVLGRVRAHIALPLLISVIGKTWTRFDDRTAVQALHSFNAILGRPSEDSIDQNALDSPSAMCTRHEITDVKDFIHAALRSSNAELQSVATTTVRFVEAHGISLWHQQDKEID